MLEELLKETGLSLEDFKQIKNTYPLTKAKEETIINKIAKNFSLFISLGYTKEEIREIALSYPPMCGRNVETIKDKIEGIVALGYTTKAIAKIITGYPPILGRTKENGRVI